MFTEKLYTEYLQGLLTGDRSRCSAIARDLLDQDIPLKELYLHLFQRSMYEVGALWERNSISVAVEHLATSITESLMSLAYPKIFAAEHIGKKAIISCVANEYHQIGGKMVADIFELHGWDGYFLGANTPVNGLLQLISDKQPDLLALSLSISFNMPNLHVVLDQVGAAHPELPVIVGGQAFLWGGTDIGARYPRVTHLSSLDQLQRYIQES